MQKLILPATIAAIMATAPFAAYAEMKTSGQISRVLVMPDDAAGDEWQFVDNSYSGSRFRFIASETADNGITYGARFEIQARENAAGNHNGGTLGDTGDNQDNRYQDLYVSGGFGKISFGKGDGAGNGAAEVDMSGTGLISASTAINDNFGGYLVAPGVEFGDVYSIADSLSRQNRVRYDTPSLSGFTLSGSIGQGNSSEFAVRYSGEMGGTKIGAAIYTATGADNPGTPASPAVPAVTTVDTGGDTVTLSPAVPAAAATPVTDGRDIMGGSISVLLSSGFNATMAISSVETGAGVDVSEGTTFKVGYKTGKHAFSVDVGDSEVGATNEGETTGFTYAFFPHKGVEMFATIRTLESNIPGGTDVDITAIGGRVKF